MEQSFELNLSPEVRSTLKSMSLSGVHFYNAAMSQRREFPGKLNRTSQRNDIASLYSIADVDLLPSSVSYQLLLELDVVTFTPARFVERTLTHFYPLTWSGRDIEIEEDDILLQPDIRLPLPSFNTPSGILTRVRVRTIINDLTLVHFRWRRVPPSAGPGRDLKRAFGYKGARGGVEEYIESLAAGRVSTEDIYILRDGIHYEAPEM